MSDEFVDPLNDPRFPDRPSHPDFWRLSEQALKLDADAEDHDVETILGQMIDPESVTYFAKQVGIMVANHTPVPEALRAVVEVIGAAVFIQGFVAGIGFERAGGHRPA